MSNEATGTMIARGAGLVLIIMSASSLLYLLPWFEPSGMVSSGWTSYSPTPTTRPTQDLATQLSNTYYVIAGSARYYIPSFGEALGGFLMILFSRPIGRWLARGLGKKDSDDGA